MNYSHAYHAGNFADVVKHAALAQCLLRLPRTRSPPWIIDTHAGAGLYDLTGEAARKSGEAAAGIGRLAADPAPPAAFAPLLDLVRRLNPDGGIATYPGSPVLIADLAAPADRITACELRADQHALLETALKSRRPDAQVLCADGFDVAAAAKGRLFLHIDPPFERGDDYDRAAALGLSAGRIGACVMVWLPLKDLETFDRFLRRLEDGRPPPTLIAEVRLRPLIQPMRMNGCALAVLNPPPGLADDLEVICLWAAQTLGESGAQARVWGLSQI